jgi:hypothetical protein
MNGLRCCTCRLQDIEEINQSQVVCVPACKVCLVHACAAEPRGDEFGVLPFLCCVAFPSCVGKTTVEKVSHATREREECNRGLAGRDATYSISTGTVQYR